MNTTFRGPCRGRSALRVAGAGAGQAAAARTGVDGTFAPHAFPKLGGGIAGLPDRPLHRGRQAHAARHHDRLGELLDPDPGHAVRPLRLHRRADDGDQGARREHAVHRGLSVDRLPVRHQEGHAADQGLGGPQGQGGGGQQGHALRDAEQAEGRGDRLRRCRSTTPSPTPRRRCCRAAPTPRSAATPSIVYAA